MVTATLDAKEIVNILKNNNASLNMYVNDGMFITRVINNQTNDVITIKSGSTIERSIYKAIQSLE